MVHVECHAIGWRRVSHAAADGTELSTTLRKFHSCKNKQR